MVGYRFPAFWLWQQEAVLRRHGLPLDAPLTDDLLREITGVEPGLYQQNEEGEWVADDAS